jgi:protein SCO1/2
MRFEHIALIAGAAIGIGATLVGFTVVAPRLTADRGNETGVAAIGGPFTLTGEDGRKVTQADLLGKPTAMFFGFTSCPEVCPTTLHELSGLIRKLGPAADRLNFVFVSVDWERDGPAELASYISAFDERIQGLSGTQAEIEAVARAYKVYYARIPVEGGYTIDHTASVFLMDRDGKFAGTLSYGEAPDTMLAKLQRLAQDA